MGGVLKKKKTPFLTSLIPGTNLELEGEGPGGGGVPDK